MTPNEEGFWSKLIIRGRQNSIGRLFLDKKFIHYTWASLFISILNIFLLWLLIDIIDIPTVISSIIVVATTFIIRYVLFDFLKVV